MIGLERTEKPISNDTYKLFAELEDIIEELSEYAKEHKEVIEIRIDGVDDDNGNQTWLNRAYSAGDDRFKDEITLFNDGNIFRTRYIYTDGGK